VEVITKLRLERKPALGSALAQRTQNANKPAGVSTHWHWHRDVATLAQRRQCVGERTLFDRAAA
jgi:hypothetical protein